MDNGEMEILKRENGSSPIRHFMKEYLKIINPIVKVFKFKGFFNFKFREMDI